MGFVKGHTKFGGRQKGRPNRATADIKALAHKHGPDAIAELARLAKHARSEMTRSGSFSTVVLVRRASR